MSESTDDQLRARLARIDPALAGPPVDLVSSPRAARLLERTMQSTDQTPDHSTDQGTDLPAASAPAAPSRWRRTGLLAAAAAAVAAVAIGVAVSGGDPAGDGPGSSDAPTTLALTVPPGGAISSCMMFDVAILRDMSPAFAGTVTSVDGGTVTLDVDRWYRGGDADQVTVSQPDGQTSAALDGVAFEEGKRYLLTAAQGVVNGCGYSGPATPELEKSYAEAFGG